MVSPGTSTAHLNGRMVAYTTVGSGAPIIFVHGSFATCSAWRRLVARLDTSACNAIALDLPGWGESDSSPEECTSLVEYEAAAVEAVAAQSNAQSIHLVAHSHGGPVALAVALAGRIEIRTLTLFEPLPIFLLGKDEDAHVKLSRFVVEYERAFDEGDHMAARAVVDLWGGAGSFEAMSANARDAIAAGTAQNIRQWKGNFAFRPSPDMLRELHVPTMLVHGERANGIAKLFVQRLRDLLPESNVADIVGASHFLIHTHAEECAQIVARSANHA
jgi:pimeloyl-ACP methyl ester carboxylesterase